MSSIEQTKEEFMTACLADGTDKEVCEARWKAAHETNPTVPQQKQSPGDADLYREIEMLKAQLKTRETQLKQAIDIANRANNERKAKDEAEKSRLIESIQLDSKFGKDELQAKSLGELQTMRLTLDKSLEKTFANVAAEIDAERRKREPLLTAGAYDPETKRWVGGV